LCISPATSPLIFPLLSAIGRNPTPILLISTYQSPSKNREKEMNDPGAATEPDPYKEDGRETFDTKGSSEPDV
jgi:hypothetical protein